MTVLIDLILTVNFWYILFIGWPSSKTQLEFTIQPWSQKFSQFCFWSIIFGNLTPDHLINPLIVIVLCVELLVNSDCIMFGAPCWTKNERSIITMLWGSGLAIYQLTRLNRIVSRSSSPIRGFPREEVDPAVFGSSKAKRESGRRKSEWLKTRGQGRTTIAPNSS